MNKGFLSKKSWHTASLKNIEKVWVAEQRHEQEQKKIDELKRQLAEEQQIDDLKKLHKEASGAKKVERLDWMYEHVAMGGSKTSAEEYLLGKKYEDKEQDELKKLNSQPGSLFLNTVNPVQDAQAKIRDDPLLAIKKEEQTSLKMILDNPVKMQQLKKEKEMQELLKRLKKDRKKKEKKDKKHEEKKLKENGRHVNSGEEESHNKRSRDGRNESPDRDFKRQRHDRDNHHREDRDSASDKYHRHRDDRDDRDRDRDRPRDDRRRDERDDNRYRGENRNSDDVRNGWDNPSWCRDRRPRASALDEKERERRLKEMMQDAEKHEEDRFKRLKREKETEEQEAKEYHSRNSEDQPGFINDMNKIVYNEDEISVEERVRRNVHYIQRRPVDEKFVR
jgi:hypothetical protein